jgi:hypothetical protein
MHKVNPAREAGFLFVFLNFLDKEQRVKFLGLYGNGRGFVESCTTHCSFITDERTRYLKNIIPLNQAVL